MLKKFLSFNLLALALFVVDRALKFYFVKNPSVRLGGDFISSLLSFHFEKNQGIAFGILFKAGILRWLIILIIFILVWFLVKAYRQNNSLEIYSLNLIIVGAISNLIDRFRYGFVIDYLDVPWFTVFNLADVMITSGVAILLIPLFFKKEEKKKVKVKDEQGKIIKAGGIIVKEEQGKKFVLLVYRQKQNDWSFPKGHCEIGESCQIAATREIKEETGIDTILVKELPLEEYINSKNEPCKMFMYHLKPLHFNTQPEHEGDLVEWVPIGQVRKRLSYKNLKIYFDKIKELL